MADTNLGTRVASRHLRPRDGTVRSTTASRPCRLREFQDATRKINARDRRILLGMLITWTLQRSCSVHGRGRDSETKTRLVGGGVRRYTLLKHSTRAIGQTAVEVKRAERIGIYHYSLARCGRCPRLPARLAHKARNPSGTLDDVSPLRGRRITQEGLPRETPLPAFVPDRSGSFNDQLFSASGKSKPKSPLQQMPR